MNQKRIPAKQESNVLKANETQCDMPTKPPNKTCDDCMTGVISCERHMGICGKAVWIACTRCSRLKCHNAKCLAKMCCQEPEALLCDLSVPLDISPAAPGLNKPEVKHETLKSMRINDCGRNLARNSRSSSVVWGRKTNRGDVKRCHVSAVPVQNVKVCSVRNFQSVPVATTPVATVAMCQETKSGSWLAPRATAAIKRDQVERTPYRNFVQKNVYDRYAALADSCSVFETDKKARKKDQQKNRLVTNMDPGPQAPFPFQGTSLTAGTPESNPKLFSGGSAETARAQKITPGENLFQRLN